MNIDDLKTTWRDLAPEECPPAPPVDRMRSGTFASLRQRLMKLYMGMVIVSVFGILLMWQYMHESPLMAVVAIMFFLIMGVLNFWYRRQIKGLNLSELTVRDALLKVLHLRRLRMAIRAVGLTMAVPLVCFMLWTFSHSYGTPLLWGGVFGTVLGVTLGLLINRRAMSALSEMEKELKE